MPFPPTQECAGSPGSLNRRGPSRFRRLHMTEAVRKASPVPRVLMVTNYGSLGGGAAAVLS